MHRYDDNESLCPFAESSEEESWKNKNSVRGRRSFSISSCPFLETNERVSRLQNITRSPVRTSTGSQSRSRSRERRASPSKSPARSPTSSRARSTSAGSSRNAEVQTSNQQRLETGFTHRSLSERHRNWYDEESSKDRRNKPYKCTHCQELLQTKADWEIHMADHNDKTPYKCRECPKQYKRRNALDYHINSVHRDRSFVCKGHGSCRVKYKSFAKLRNHIARAHNGVNEQHICPGCSKPFAYKCTLVVHMKKCRKM